MIEIGNVDVVTVRLNTLAQPGVVVGSGAGEIPVGKLEISSFVEEVPMDDAAGVDEMDFNIRGAGDFIEIEARRREAIKRGQSATLQQFGQGALEGDFKAWMRTETGKNALVVRIEHGHGHHRVFAAERGVLDQNAETGRAQAGNAGCDGRVTGDDFIRHVWQAEAFADYLEFDVAFENFGQRLSACFSLRVAG